MALPTYEAAVGAARDIAFTAIDPDTGLAYASSRWAAGDTLACSVWLGNGRAAAFAPAVSWVSASAGTGTIRMAAADTLALAPARYRGQVRVTDVSDSNRVFALFEFYLTLTDSPGTAVAEPVYGSLDGMRRKSGEDLDGLLERSDLGDGNELLAEGRRGVDREVMSRARTIVETQAERHVPVEASDPVEITDGVDDGPSWGLSVYPDTSVRDQLDAIDGYLDDDMLMTTGARDRAAVDACEHLALAELFGRQTGQGDADEKYRALASKHRVLAARLLAGWTARIDTDDDGTADMELQPV